jgi:hypothetical protein
LTFRNGITVNQDAWVDREVARDVAVEDDLDDVVANVPLIEAGSLFCGIKHVSETLRPSIGAMLFRGLSRLSQDLLPLKLHAQKGGKT